MEYNLLPAQRQFFEIPHDNDTDIAVYQGGYGSGKTFSGSLLGVLLAIRFPGIRGLVGAQTYGLVRDTTLQSYFEHLENINYPYKWKEKEGKLIFPNKSEILFRHLEEPDKLKSLNLGFVEIEEMSDVPYDTFKMLLGRLRQAQKPDWENFRYRLFGHTNPEPNVGWLKETFVTKKKDYYRRIIAPTTDNKYLPASYIQTMKDEFNEDYYKMYVLGQDNDYVDGLITKRFCKEKQVRPLTIDKKFPIHISCDFNVDPMCWYLIQDYDDTTRIIKEYIQINTTTDLAMTQLLEDLTGFEEHDIIINGDATGSSNTTKGADYAIMLNAFIKKGFKDVKIRHLPKNPPIEWRITCWNNRIFGPDGEHHVLIDDSCEMLIYNIENLQIKPGTSKPKTPYANDIKKDPKKKFLGHPIDAVTYNICLYHPIKVLTTTEYQGGSMGDPYGDKYEDD